jgi:hypothetical protein
MSVLYLFSGYGAPPEAVARHPGTRVLPQAELTVADLARARGLVTGNLLDQDALLAFRDALERFLDAGGRWFFNGHMMRPLVEGLGRYAPMDKPSRADFDQTRLAPHPIFEGIEIGKLETNRGVAGFYGRGANALPDGAIPVTGLRGGLVAVDWLWCRPRGGRVFSHAGNDLGQMGLEWGLSPEMHRRILDWAAGGPCLCD